MKHEQAMPLPQRVVAAFASFVMAMMMVVAVPSTALADTASVTVSTATASVDAGSTLPMPQFFSFTYGDSSTEHVDYVVTNGTGTATINKHNGTLTATAAGQVSVTAYITNGERGNGSAGVCGGDDAVQASGTKTVTINPVEASGYGYQGTEFQIYMSSPTVTATSTDTTGTVTKYTNTVPNQETDDEVSFTFYQNAGLNQYLNYYGTGYWGYATPEAAYKALAGQYISYTTPSGTTTTLAASTALNVTSVTSSSVTISVPTGTIAGTGTLSFNHALHTFKNNVNLGYPPTNTVNKSLGVDIDFSFNVVD